MVLVTMKNVSQMLLQGWLYFFRRIKLLVPVLIGILLYIPVLHYIAIGHNFVESSWVEFGIRVALFLVAVPFIAMFVSLVVIELMKQQYEEHRMSLLNAFYKGWGKGFIKALPVMLLWSLFRYVLVLAKFAFAPKRFGDNQYSQHAREVSKSTSGKRFIDVYEVAKWEGGNNGFTNAFRRGLRPFFMVWLTSLLSVSGYRKPTKLASDAYMNHVGIIKTAYGLHYFILLVLLVPMLFAFGYITSLPNQQVISIVVFAYLGVLWLLLTIIKQMLMTGLYLWYRKWQDNMNEQGDNAEKKPTFYSTEKPEFLVYLYATYFVELDVDREDKVEPM